MGADGKTEELTAKYLRRGRGRGIRGREKQGETQSLAGIVPVPGVATSGCIAQGIRYGWTTDPGRAEDGRGRGRLDIVGTASLQ